MRKLLIIAIILFVAHACKKNDDVVPSVHVDIYINTQLPQFIALQTPLNWVYYSAGNRGLIIYRRNATDFTVLERTCTYDASVSTAIVEVMQDNITCVDSTCGSKFSVNDGSVMNGPAAHPLQQYNSTFDGTILHIYN